MSPARRTAALVAVLLALAASLLTTPAQGAGAPTTAVPAALPSGWTARPESYPGTVTRKNLLIPMSDGLRLRGDLILPARADGTAVSRPLPVIVQITAYNKAVIGAGSPLTPGPSYLVRRGYAYLVVDARGTGTSPGTWQVFGPREQKDAGEVVTWASQRAWSNGKVGMAGASYMGISQLFAAGQQPRGLKAIFPQVPSAEVYRDVVASGGQLDVGFMPLWLGLVSLTSMIPSGEEDSLASLQTILGHLPGTAGTSLQLALEGLTGGEQAYDGPWYRNRSTLTRAVPRISVPTFLVGGEYDLFQRGTPLVFQALQERGVPVKMVLGPWNHLEGSSAAGIGEAGYGTIEELQLRWFDRYVRGAADPALDTDIPDFTYYELGADRWVKRNGYLTRQHAETYRLSGSSVTALTKGSLVQGDSVTAGTSTMLPLPVSGLCSRSATQWTAGASSAITGETPCDTDQTVNDLSGVVFETAPLTSSLRMLGPINARLYASSLTGDGMLAVNVSRVGTDGTVERLTGGWQVISLAKLDRSRSEILDGEVIQPWHPFTRESQRVRAPGEVTPIDVEIFPTGARIAPGERLRISVTAFDVPHLLPGLPLLAGMLSPITLYNSSTYPSRITFPAL